MRAASFALVCWALVASGCAIDDLDHTGKGCPCPSGWDCDQATQTCGHCKVAATDFQVGWTTPNSIRWAWEPRGDVASFSRYELELRAADGALTVVGAEQNAELGKFELPRTGGNSDFVRATVTRGLDPSALYSARLLAYDNAGCVSASSSVEARTADDPQQEIALLEPGDAGNAGTFPMACECADECACAGQSCMGCAAALELTADASACAPAAVCLVYEPACACAEVLKVSGLAKDLGAVGSNVAETAVLEMRIEAPATSYYSGVFLLLDSETGEPFGFEPFTMTGATGYGTWQIPLRALAREGAPPTQADLAIFGSFAEQARLRVGDVKVRW